MRCAPINRILQLTCAVALLFALLPSASVASDEKQRTLRIDYPDFWPFFTQTKDGEMTGFFHEIIQEALRQMDIDPLWQSYPWGRCQEHVKTGEADAIITVPTEERLNYTTTHKTPFYEKELNVFTYAGHHKLKEIRSIRTIGDIWKNSFSVITYVGNGWNDKNIKSRGIKTYETPHLTNVWYMLSHKRGDIVIEWPGAAWPAIHEEQLEDGIIQTDVSLQSMPFHLLIRSDSPHARRLDEFDIIIRKMLSDGTIDRIVKKYQQISPPVKTP